MSKKRKKLVEYILVFCGIVGVLFLYMGLSGVLLSGYHIMDDEEIYFWTNDVYRHYGFFNGLWHQLIGDIVGFGRFRYTWVIIRWMEIRVFGDNMLAWHIYQTLFDCCVLFSIYIFINKLRIRRFYFFVFSFLLYFGYQAQILWMLGPQENIGVFFLTISFIYWINYQEKPTKMRLITLILALFFLAGSKESFLILLPGLPLVFYYLSKRSRDELSLKMFLKENKKLFFYIYILFLLCIIRIITVDIGEAGALKEEINIAEKISLLLNNLFFRLQAYAAAGVVAGIIIIFGTYKYNKSKLGKLGLLIIITIYALATQLFVYMGKDMAWRYLIPTTYFFALFFVFVWNDILNGSRKVIIITIVLTCGITGYANRNSMRFAKVYADDGKSLSCMFNKVADTMKEGDKVLLLLDPEGSVATKEYLRNNNNVSVSYIEREKISADEVDIICVSDAIDDYKYIQDEIKLSDEWVVYKNGMYIVYYKE